MIEFLFFTMKMIVVIFGMKYLSQVLIALVTKEKPKRERKWSDPYFKDSNI